MGKLTKVVGLAGAAAGAVYLSKSENREMVKSQLNKAMKSLNSTYVKDLGKPTETDDAKMVDEGAMTSVQYYNELQEKAQSE